MISTREEFPHHADSLFFSTRTKRRKKQKKTIRNVTETIKKIESKETAYMYVDLPSVWLGILSTAKMKSSLKKINPTIEKR